MTAKAPALEQIIPTRAPAYTRSAIGLHWMIALLIFAAFPLGLYMHGLALSPTKLRLFSYHKWIGVTVFLLAVARLAWRLFHRPPDLPAGMRQWERAAALITHGLLYILIFAVPVSGWLMSSATGFQTVWFGLLPLPDLIGKDRELGRLLLEVHEWLNYLMLALVCLHVAAALKHHFMARDDVLAQMLPSLRNFRHH